MWTNILDMQAIMRLDTLTLGSFAEIRSLDNKMSDYMKRDPIIAMISLTNSVAQ